MTELELQQYLLREYPQENARCEWKEFKNLKNSFCGDEKDDVISYVSAIANMEGGHLVIGVHVMMGTLLRPNPQAQRIQPSAFLCRKRWSCSKAYSKGARMSLPKDGIAIRLRSLAISLYVNGNGTGNSATSVNTNVQNVLTESSLHYHTNISSITLRVRMPMGVM